MYQCGLKYPVLFDQRSDLPANLSRIYDDENEDGYEGQCANMVVLPDKEKG